ncbi:MAG: hypothetical protein QGG96_03710 [Candidatus Poseidoniaceae archaeon]|jgi:hypothetical protein|nr:hypothetical protein [Candidatus Poseidoniaceae archaeon]
MNEGKASWKLLVMAAMLPILVLVAIDVSMGGGFVDEDFKRFGNALLTSYVVMGLLLMGNLFFYADSRHRPLAPFVGMFLAIAVGVIITWALISNDDLLLEANSGMRSQVLSNIVHLLVSGAAMLLAALLAIGTTFAAITGRSKMVLFEEEE